MKQANLGLRVDELVAQQAWLQARARAILTERHLFDILSECGRPEIVGSYRMGLMVWPDIDITVTTPGVPDLDAALAVIPRLMKEAGAHKLNIVDRRGRANDHLPAGIYLGPDIVHEEIAWQVDIWLVDRATVIERQAQTDRFMARMTDTHRRAILAIKQVAAASDVYHRGVSSVDISTAVLEDGVTTPEAFVAWLARSGRSL